MNDTLSFVYEGETMSQYEVKIANAKAAVVISNLKCVDCPGDPKMHVGFDVSFESYEYKFKVNFSEMLYMQFDFKRGTSQIVDENFQERRLIIDSDSVCLQILQNNNDELSDIQLQFTLKVDSTKVDNFKIELCAYVDHILKR